MSNFDNHLDNYLKTFNRLKRDAFYLPGSSLPTIEDIEEIENLLLELFFPSIRSSDEGSLKITLRRTMTELASRLHRAISEALKYENPEANPMELEKAAWDHVDALLGNLGSIRADLKLDATAGFYGDPAAKSVHEVILCYPCLRTMSVYRVAHFLLERGVPLVPRMMSETVHMQTGIDIHPGARIGKSFFIDHGTGVVIGETTIIGDNVKLYQGVTLGALSIPKREEGMCKRHPTIGDNVTIYSHAVILGNVTIGENSTISSNAWIKSDIPANSYVFAATPDIEVKTKTSRR